MIKKLAPYIGEYKKHKNRRNIFTFFNMICIAVAIGLVAVGAYTDMTFMVIVILNTTIGIVQEIYFTEN